MSGVPLLLAGDIGGTKTSLGLFSRDAGPRRPIATTTVASRQHSGLAEICRRFLADARAPVRHAVFGVAGPVLHGRAKITNLPWQLDERELAADLGFERAVLLNDLASLIHAIPRLREDEATEILPGTPDDGPIAVIAPGTGLGMAYATREGRGLVAHASEGGHGAFAPRGELQEGLLAFLRAQHGHVSRELVCSGRGMPNLYSYLRERGPLDEPTWLAHALAGAEDRTPVIAHAAFGTEPPVPLAVSTLELFAEILGAVAGDLAATVLATGGLYVGGGIAPRMLALLRDGGFREAFVSKGLMRRVVETVPLRVILNSDAALYGAAAYGLARLPW
jgi:glucokinase